MEIDKKTPVDDTINEKDVQIGTITELDEGEVFLRQHGFNQEAIQALLDDEPRNKALVRKVDLVLLPLLSGTYMLQYIDKSALAYSAVFDLLSSTHMSSNQYSWLASIFYFAYLVAEYPWNILAQKTKLAKVVSGNVIAWGAMLMITAACSSFTGMAICRFLLGVFEAPITPCFMLMIGMWYTRAQQPFRAGVFYSCNGLGAMVGGILTYGIGQIDTIAVWRAIYLILGGITLVWGVVMLLFLPDDVISSKSFTLDEKALLIGRARLGQTGIMNHKIKWYQIREALIDPQVWILFFFTLLNEVVNGGIASFGKLIIKGLTDDSATAVALGIPFGGFQIFYVLGGTYLASRIRNFRTVVMFIYLLPTILGASLLWKLDHKTYKVGVLFGYYIIGAYVCSLVLALQMPATNLGGYTKRTTSVALVFLAYCAGNIIGPHAFLAKEAPIYQTGVKLILACSSAQAALAVLLRFVLARRNKQRDAAAAAVGQLESSTDQSAGADLTDFEASDYHLFLFVISLLTS
ncbi:Major facilitator superfamily domain, general substrate transporter [Penicillium expansum]|nr:Major facilitator superfamily domain, general substrate transporter [Penicillium expansum]